MPPTSLVNNNNCISYCSTSFPAMAASNIVEARGLASYLQKAASTAKINGRSGKLHLAMAETWASLCATLLSISLKSPVLPGRGAKVSSRGARSHLLFLSFELGVQVIPPITANNLQISELDYQHSK